MQNDKIWIRKLTVPHDGHRHDVHFDDVSQQSANVQNWQRDFRGSIRPARGGTEEYFGLGDFHPERSSDTCS